MGKSTAISGYGGIMANSAVHDRTDGPACIHNLQLKTSCLSPG